MIEIEDYEPQAGGKATIAIFTVYLPQAKMRIRKLRLIRLKNQQLMVGMPSYSPNPPDANLGGSKREFKAYVEFSKEKQEEFEKKVLEELKNFS